MDERFRAILAQSILLRLMELSPAQTAEATGRKRLRYVAIDEADSFIRELEETKHGK